MDCKTTSGEYGTTKVPCIFPFKYNGITYNACTTDQTNPGDPAWCATEVDEMGLEVKDKYGYCEEKCQPGKLIFFETFGLSSRKIIYSKGQIFTNGYLISPM